MDKDIVNSWMFNSIEGVYECSFVQQYRMPEAGLDTDVCAQYFNDPFNATQTV